METASHGEAQGNRQYFPNEGKQELVDQVLQAERRIGTGIQQVTHEGRREGAAETEIHRDGQGD